MSADGVCRGCAVSSDCSEDDPCEFCWCHTRGPQFESRLQQKMRRSRERAERKLVRPRTGDPTVSRRRQVLDRDLWRCRYCGVKLTVETFSIDHVMPKSRKGTNQIDNLVAACRPCNVEKGNRTPDEADMPLLNVEDWTSGDADVVALLGMGSDTLTWFDRAVSAWRTGDRAAAFALLNEGWAGIAYTMGYLGTYPEQKAAAAWWHRVENEYDACRV